MSFIEKTCALIIGGLLLLVCLAVPRGETAPAPAPQHISPVTPPGGVIEVPRGPGWAGTKDPGPHTQP